MYKSINLRNDISLPTCSRCFHLLLQVNNFASSITDAFTIMCIQWVRYAQKVIHGSRYSRQLLLRRLPLACVYDSAVLLFSVHNAYIWCDTKIVRTCNDKPDTLKNKICFFEIIFRQFSFSHFIT